MAHTHHGWMQQVALVPTFLDALQLHPLPERGKKGSAG